ncbi:MULTISPECIES: hypothetical protein [Rhizobium]|uniref:hypothetical protein n=1 Tax=Rhizobium TaxID=379 RepID=UPI0017D063F2|nr:MULTISPECIES: hypothetical protein [Rhizobium]MBB3745705.1 hypothetical protein [Rhizobium sp. BK591]UTS92372.1 hypothetical protein NE851_15415 [Rhizobium anhuiense bv. trifolii]
MEYEATRKKEAGHAQRHRNHRRGDRGGPGITEFYDPWEEKLPKDMFPAAIRSILVAVSRVVRERHPELPQFVASEDASSRYPS